jgi:hypothetical protein
MTEQFETKPHPKLSYGNHIDDDAMIVIKVDEGKFEGTVFNYRDVKMNDDSDDVGYGIDFHSFLVDGEDHETEPSIKVLTEFYEQVTSPFLYNIVVHAANQAKE